MKTLDMVFRILIGSVSTLLYCFVGLFLLTISSDAGTDTPLFIGMSVAVIPITISLVLGTWWILFRTPRASLSEIGYTFRRLKYIILVVLAALFGLYEFFN